MITLNDYLYSGDTVLKILQKYTRDLRKEAKLTHNEIDMMHVNFLIQITELLEHNDFLTAQSQKIRVNLTLQFIFHCSIALFRCHKVAVLGRVGSP